MSKHVIRPVLPDEWEQVKELRLSALSDPAAPVAFLETVQEAAGRSDAYWQERTARAAEGRYARQFIAEAPDGQWDGSVTALVEEGGTDDFFGFPVAETQVHLVGVFVRAEQRGTGLTEDLFQAAVDWAWSLEEPTPVRVRLFVHEANARAAAFYRRFGFVASGHVVSVPGDPDAQEWEYVLVRP